MDSAKKSIRPRIELKKASTEKEKFQNEVLRPVLKLQHDVLVQLFVSFSRKQKTDVVNLSEEKLTEFIKQSVAKNIVLKNQLVGIVIGQFTKEEFIAYNQHSSDFNKRIFSMVCKRLLDNFYN